MTPTQTSAHAASALVGERDVTDVVATIAPPTAVEVSGSAWQGCGDAR